MKRVGAGVGVGIVGVTLGAGVVWAAWPATMETSRLDAVVTGTAAGGHLGAQVAILRQRGPVDCDGDGLAGDPVGDFDGDGRDDLAIGVPADGTTGFEAGQVLVFLGRGAWSRDLDPADANLVLNGEAEFDAAGAALAGGDVNGDCVTDLIVGAPGYGDFRGRVYVFFGGDGLGASPRSLATADVVLDGADAAGRFGAAVDAGVDVTGDRRSDLLVGAPTADAPGGTVDVGKGWVVAGAAALASGPVNSRPTGAWSFYGAAVSENLGQAVALSRDVHGGARADVILGAPGATVSGGANTGKVYLVRGEGSGSWAAATKVDTLASITWQGAAAGHRTGATLAALGDVSDDALGDLGLGAPGASSGAGFTWVVFGESGLAGVKTLASPAYLSLAGASAGDDLAHPAGLGDVDGDEVDDFAVGAPGAGGVQADRSDAPGAVYVFYGQATGWAGLTPLAADLRFDGAAPGAQLGSAVGGWGDVDGDASVDLLLGAGGDASGKGRAFVARSRLFTDSDEDGLTPEDGDCDDDRDDVYPGAEDLRCDGVDQDCDGEDFGDSDGDGFSGCEAVPDGERDCDDGNPDTRPDAAEACDGEDNDCDGSVDEGALTTYYQDQDEDGAGWYYFTQEACQPPAGYVLNDDDCDDEEPLAYPGGEEACDGLDNDCDNRSDEGTLSTFYRDADDDGYGDTPQDACNASLGYVALGGDCDDANPDVNPGAPEICGDGVDEDCSGAASDRDLDEDGWVDAACPDYAGEQGGDCRDDREDVNPAQAEICGDGLDNDCSGAEDDAALDADNDGHVTALCGGDDCDDTNRLIHPGLQDQCGDGLDNDCSGEVDDLDNDRDGSVSAACGGDDCDDANPNRHPGRTEVVCDKVDQDCDGLDLTDVDDDGYAQCGTGLLDCDDTDAGISPATPEVPYDTVDQDCDGFDLTDVDNDGYNGGPGGPDCDDEAPLVNPGANETPYDGIDQDCREGDLTDVDGDGWDGGPGGDDCADTNAGRNPGAEEIAYDGIDQDCDGEDLIDADGDGHAASSLGGDDCDDTDDTVYTGAYEDPFDGKDNNCNDRTDDYADDIDHDADGYTADAEPADCAPLDAAVHPGAVEVVDNGIDDDCDGFKDEPDADVGYQTDTGCGGCGGTEAPTPASGGLWLSLLVGAARLTRGRRRR